MLSIIIPSYNRPNYLRQALNSLMIQTKTRFFTVIVDDCSTESLQEVINEFQDKLNLVYLRQPQNLGVAAARQRGLEWAISHNMEFLMFLDSDDMLMPHAVDRLTYEINHCRCDMIVSSITIEKENGVGSIISSEEALTWTHGKIYRVNFLKENNISFINAPKTNEDLYFNLCCNYITLKTKKAKQIDECLYLWRQRSNSLTHISETRNRCIGEDYINTIYQYAIFCIEHGSITSDILPNIVAIYDYHQFIYSLNNQISEDIVEKEKFLINLPIVQKELFIDKGALKYMNNAHQCKIDNKKIYWFKETFIEWFNKLTFKENENADSNC